MDNSPVPRTIDLRDQVCPMTFVRTRLALDGLDPGQTLVVLLAGSEAQARVPMTIVEQGHDVLQTEMDTDGTMRLLVRKRI